MKYLKNFKQFIENMQNDILYTDIDISESMKKGTFESLLVSIGAKKLNIFKELILPFDFNIDIENLNNSVEFINSLSSIGMKKSQLQKTDEFETFIDKPFKFILIHRKNDNELLDPVYILLQENNININESELYKITKPFKNFYDEISCKDIELTLDDKKVVYTTSNGTEWELKDKSKGDDTFKDIFRNSELKELIIDKNIEYKVL